MTPENELAKRDTAGAVEIGMAEPEYEALRDICILLIARGRQEFLRIMWDVGREIVAIIGVERQEYGAQVVHRLANDLGMDHTNIKRAIDFYKTYPLEVIGAGSATVQGAKSSPDTANLARALTWEKVKMLLPLPPELRQEMEKRLASGEIRTDEALRTAILDRKMELGLIDTDITQPRQLGLTGGAFEKMRVLVRRVGPDGGQLRTIMATWVEDWARIFGKHIPAEQKIENRRALLALAEDVRRAAEEYGGKDD
jgi:hypothetical protein